MNTFNITRNAAIEIWPTTLSLEIGYVEDTPDGEVVNIRIIQKQITPYGEKTQDETKKFPISMKDVITGYDLVSKEPIFDLQMLSGIMQTFGINLEIP